MSKSGRNSESFSKKASLRWGEIAIRSPLFKVSITQFLASVT